jgi:hypothetical protein
MDLSARLLGEQSGHKSLVSSTTTVPETAFKKRGRGRQDGPREDRCEYEYVDDSLGEALSNDMA